MVLGAEMVKEPGVESLTELGAGLAKEPGVGPETEPKARLADRKKLLVLMIIYYNYQC